MGTYIVQGGRKIEGEFTVHGSKNGTLPILAACVLAEDEVILENVPRIRDVLQMLEILKELLCGCRKPIWNGYIVFYRNQKDYLKDIFIQIQNL